MNRRSFFKFLPVAPVVMIAEGARAATVDQEPTENIITLIPQKDVEHNTSPNTFRMIERDPSRNLHISVGRDGNLWIKSVKDNMWKRVQTLSP